MTGASTILVLTGSPVDSVTDTTRIPASFQQTFRVGKSPVLQISQSGVVAESTGLDPACLGLHPRFASH